MDSGRIKFEKYNGILYCEGCMNDEFLLDDLDVIRKEIRKNYSSPIDVIYKRSGSYSVAPEAQKILFRGIDEFRNFIYVVDSDLKRDAAMYAAETYMWKYNTRVVGTKEAAYALLNEAA